MVDSRPGPAASEQDSQPSPARQGAGREGAARGNLTTPPGASLVAPRPPAKPSSTRRRQRATSPRDRADLDALCGSWIFCSYAFMSSGLEIGGDLVPDDCWHH